MAPTMSIFLESDHITPYTLAAYEIVGDHQVKISLDKSVHEYNIPGFLLTDVSIYFQVVLFGDFEEGKTETLKLPDTDEDVLHLFLYWLQYRELVWDELAGDPDGHKFESGVSLLLRAYAFADRYLIGELFYSIFKVLLSAVKDSQDKITASLISEAFHHGGYNTSPSILLTRCVVASSLNDPAAAAQMLEDCGAIRGFLPAFVIQISDARARASINDRCWWKSLGWGKMQSYERSLKVHAELVTGRAKKQTAEAPQSVFEQRG
ncbi:hypothetical protein AMS68_007484 [Peltaster fructicola]|uniref:BTB domain-containing protein n=1 Tax=Peltaster fructicola TaxID=286661 RepID=A0A6H0Y4L0_9PEZI|nr:hypothetical protein AMS68_007484 [Peltaster fructicola]